MPARRSLTFFNPGDCIVVNNTKIDSRRLFGGRNTAARWRPFVQALFPMNPARRAENPWVRPGKRSRSAARFEIAGVKTTVESIKDDGARSPL